MTAPAWLAVLANAYRADEFPQVWTIEQVAAHLGIRQAAARVALSKGGVAPVMRSSEPGAPYFYSPMDVEELRQRREWRPRGVLRRPTALRARDGKRARWAARELVDGRLVATRATVHGSASTYNNHGCRCQPCTDAHLAKMAAYHESRRAS